MENTMEQLFKECCDFIDAEYQRLDHTLGYRFLTCSHTLLNPDIKLLYLSQSPAGSTDIKRMSGIHLAIQVFSKGYRPKQGKVAP